MGRLSVTRRQRIPADRPPGLWAKVPQAFKGGWDTEASIDALWGAFPGHPGHQGSLSEEAGVGLYLRVKRSPGTKNITRRGIQNSGSRKRKRWVICLSDSGLPG